LLSTLETSVDGLRTWQTNAGAVITSVKTVPSGAAYTMTATNGDGSYAVSLYQSGRLTSVTRYPSSGGPIGQTTYGYDAHGRQDAITDARNGTTTLTFNNADQAVSVTTPAPGTGQSPQTTTTYYDCMLRATNIVQPDGTSVITVFSPRGELLRTSGSRTYPVGYAYDAQGRLRYMTNWSGYPSTGVRVTEWNYDAARGWLANKRYPDATTGNPSSIGPNYTNTAAGRLSGRRWARGTNTTYSYNNYGDLSGVSYTGGSTPALTYTYTRRGQQATITQGANSWKRFYTTPGSLLSEAWTGGLLNGLAVTNAYDGFLRRTNVATRNGATSLTTNGYTYDLAGRLDTVSLPGYSVTYSYLANSPLVSQNAFKQGANVRMTATKQYDRLNRLVQISTTTNSSATVVRGFGYLYNDANQRVRTTLADGSSWVYEYDALGQVISGKKYWADGTPLAGQQFEYGFDDIGNRASTKAGGDANGAGLRSATYTANRLNQYSSRTVPGAVDIIGAATATATNVNVNNQMAYRRGEYYWKELSITNTSAAQWQAVTNRAVQSGTTNLVTGNVFLPQTPESFGYDADGNLTNDGRWSYTWDAENRLLQIESPTSAPTGSKRRLTFAYDYQGRRIHEAVQRYTNSNWSIVLSNRFLYDGWNVLAELNATNNAVVRSYLWGLDLSGSLQGAGGVGGLLAVRAHSGGNAGTYFCGYDGNGNMAILVNAADGSESARYEYGPFAEPIRATGLLAKESPFRFSTKYQDDESDLLYYGYRFYNSSLGRWLNRDPKGKRGGQNLYSMSSNDRVDSYDLWVFWQASG
jgi:RHS repeat-associated protein